LGVSRGLPHCLSHNGVSVPGPIYRANIFSGLKPDRGDGMPPCGRVSPARALQDACEEPRLRRRDRRRPQPRDHTVRMQLVVLGSAGRHLLASADALDCPPSPFTSGLRVATTTGSPDRATSCVLGGDGGLSRSSGIGPSIWLPPPCLVGWPAPSHPPRRVDPLAATTYVSDECRFGVWPKRIVVVTASIDFLGVPRLSAWTNWVA